MTVAYAANGRQLSFLPLAVALGLHLLLGALFLLSTSHRPIVDAGRRLISVLVRVPPPARPPASPSPAAPRSTNPGAAPSAPAPVVPYAAPAAPQTVPVTPAEPSPPAAPMSEQADEFLTRSRQQAREIDRAMRGGKSGVPADSDTPMARFRRALEGAHKDTSRTIAMETFTSPDGVVTYRFRQGDKVWCRKGGAVAPDMIGRSEGAILAGAGGAGSATTAGKIECP